MRLFIKCHTIYLIIMMFLLMTSFTLIHKFFVSVTEVELNKEEKSVQIITRLFIDDIEEVLEKRYNISKLYLGEEKENPLVDQYLTEYLTQKMSFVINGREVELTFIGKEYEDDLMICYLEIQKIRSIKTIELKNEVLMDVFEEQQNIVHVKIEDERKSVILERQREQGMLKFSK